MLGHLIFSTACAVLIAVAIVRVVPSRVMTPPFRAAQRDVIQHGTKVPSLEGVDFERAGITVAVMIHSECQFCADSLPFYRRLSALRSEGKIQLIALSHEPLDTFRPYLSQRDIHVDGVGHLQGSEITTAGTPTLLLIGRDGTVRGSWLGRLARWQEEEVIGQLTSAVFTNTGR